MAKGYVTKAVMEKELEETREELKRKESELKKNEEELRAKEEGWKRMKLDADAELEKTRESLEEEKERCKKKDAQLARLRKHPGKLGYVDQGVMAWDVEVAEVTDAGIFSPPSSIGGVPFRIQCLSTMHDGSKHLEFITRCNDDTAAEKTSHGKLLYNFTLLSSVVNLATTKTYMVRPAKAGKGFSTLVPWDDAVDPENGFIHNGRLSIQVEIKLIFLYKNAAPDFSCPAPSLSDVILIVGEKPFHSSKVFLAHFSGYFKALFFSEFAEKGMDRVELPDFEPSEFKNLLEMIHPQRVKTKVNKTNVEYLIHLADYFDVQAVLWECIDYLKKTREVALSAKLLLTEQYQLPELQDHLMQYLESAYNLKEVINSTDFADMSQEFQTFALQQHFKLSSQG